MSNQTNNQRGLSVVPANTGRGISLRNDRRLTQAAEKIEVEKRKAVNAAHAQTEVYRDAARMARDGMGAVKHDFDELIAQNASLKPEAEEWFGRLTTGYKEKFMAGYNKGMERI